MFQGFGDGQTTLKNTRTNRRGLRNQDIVTNSVRNRKIVRPLWISECRKNCHSKPKKRKFKLV